MAYAWPQLDQVQQNELLGEMTVAVVGALAPGWQQVMLDFRAVGRAIDVAVGVNDANGVQHLWDPPADVWKMFQRLRGGMYVAGEGTWFSARYIVEPRSQFRIQYNWRNLPAFDPAPATEQFAIEQERFPRGEAYMPTWYRERLVQAQAQA